MYSNLLKPIHEFDILKDVFKPVLTNITTMHSNWTNIWIELRKDLEARIVAVYREANHYADALAKLGVNHRGGIKYYDSSQENIYPQCLKKQIYRQVFHWSINNKRLV